jgi:hypothetical protein
LSAALQYIAFSSKHKNQAEYQNMSAVQLYQVPLAGAIDSQDAPYADRWAKVIANIKEADGLRSVSWSHQAEKPEIASIAAGILARDISHLLSVSLPVLRFSISG